MRSAAIRIVDLPGDLADRARRKRLPPASLRYAVSDTTSRRSFRRAGQCAAQAIVAAPTSFEPDAVGMVRFLDFGCGCGRVAAPLLDLCPRIALTGIDIDVRAIDWCRSNLRGDFRYADPAGMLPLPAEAFDIVYAINVFTHLDERRQLASVAEILRVLRPGGFFIVTTCSPQLIIANGNADEAMHESLRNRGFAFVSVRGGTRFNDDYSYQSHEYLQSAWSPGLELLRHHPFGLGNRDLAIFRRPQ